MASYTPKYIDRDYLIRQIPAQILTLLTNDDVNGTSEIEKIVNECIELSENILESYLGTRYDLPLFTSSGAVPKIVQNIVLALAKYFLYSRRNLQQNAQDDYDAAFTMIKDIVSQKADLPVQEPDGSYKSLQKSGIIIGQMKSKFNKFGI